MEREKITYPYKTYEKKKVKIFFFFEYLFNVLLMFGVIWGTRKAHMNNNFRWFLGIFGGGGPSDWDNAWSERAVEAYAAVVWSIEFSL